MRKRNDRIFVHLDKEEHQHLSKLVKRSKLSQEAYIRHLINGVVPIDAPPPDLRIVIGARRPMTQREIEFLFPLFEEVYLSALAVNRRLNEKVELFIMNDMDVNACAIGRRTIAVTRGLIDTMDEDEIKGVLAHEFGHISYGDTKALLLQNIGNGLFAILVWIFNLEPVLIV